MRIEKNAPLLTRNTFAIEARSAQWVEYESANELRELILSGALGAQPPLLHIGGGSNLLFTKDFPGTLLHSAIGGLTVVSEDAAQAVIEVGASYVWDDLVAHTLQRGWFGLENLSYIPGEVGASAVQNIGAYGAEVAQRIVSVKCMDLSSGELRVFPAEECRYAYRQSIFKTQLLGRYAVLSVRLRLSKEFRPQLSYGGLLGVLESRGIVPEELTALQLRELIIEVRRSKLPEPHETGSAGSFFKNPIVPEAQAYSLLQQWPGAPHYQVDGGVKIPAGWMIEQCGWRGRSLGRAGVWERQALVLVNRGGATGEEILRLCHTIQNDVERKFGIRLSPEVNII